VKLLAFARLKRRFPSPRELFGPRFDQFNPRGDTVSRNRRVRTAVANNFDSLLNAYSIAAAAAGVSVLAAATPAAAKIVITHASIPIPACSFYTPCPVYLDLNKDGINDFELKLISSTYAYYNWRHVSATGLSGGALMGKGPGKPPWNSNYASCLVQGAKIGPSAHFKNSALMELSTVYSFNKTSGKYFRYLYGKWGGNHADRFLGVKFKIDGKTHYGWIRVKVNSSSPKKLSATITEYGYETITNKTVKAGLSGTDSVETKVEHNGAQSMTVSLGALAAGVDGLSLWRREETLASN